MLDKCTHSSVCTLYYTGFRIYSFLRSPGSLFRLVLSRSSQHYNIINYFYFFLLFWWHHHSCLLNNEMSCSLSLLIYLHYISQEGSGVGHRLVIGRSWCCSLWLPENRRGSWPTRTKRTIWDPGCQNWAVDCNKTKLDSMGRWVCESRTMLQKR